MKRLTRTALLAIVAGSAFFLYGCASTTMESIHRAPGFEARRIHKILVVGALKQPGVRKAFEDECVRWLKARHVDAVASLAVLPSATPLSKVGVAGFAKAQGFDTVLVTRLMSRDDIETPIAHPPGSPEMMIEDDSNLDPTLEAIEASPEYDEHYRIAILRTNVYDVANGQKLWSSTTQTLVTSHFLKDVDSFCEVILRKLYEKNNA